MDVEIKEDSLPQNKNNSHLLSGGLLARNTIINLIGQALPMIVAFATMPFIIDGLGRERFGILTLAWMVVGYFSLFDMGLGRATTKFVAEYIARGESDKLSNIVWASILMLFGFGVLGLIVAVLITPWLVNDVLNIPLELIDESTTAFYLLAFSVPVVLGIAGVRGVLEAMQKFYIINMIKVPTYIAAFITPLLVLPFTNSLVPIVLLLIGSRLAGLIAFTYFCFKEIPDLRHLKIPSLKYIKQLLGFGGWLTISNIIWPIMNYLDRFLIGAVLTMTAVTYYVTPYELVTKLLIISGSLLSVIFPAFSAYSNGKHNKLMRLHARAIKYILLVLVPVVFLAIALAVPFFKFWLDDDFAQHSSIILQILAIGILISSVSQVSSSAIQAMGHPDITAKLHMMELPIYLGMLWYLVHSMGITGAAIAWVVRIIIDTTLYFYLFYRLSPVERQDRETPQLSLLTWSVIMLVVGYMLTHVTNIYIHIGLTAILFAISLIFVYRKFLDKDEVEYIKEFVSVPFRRSASA